MSRMAKALNSWNRQYYADCEGDAFLFFVAFGEIAQNRRMDSRKYRCVGVPTGFELMAYDRGCHDEVIDGFLQGYLWERLLVENNALARAIERSPGCVVLRGSQRNPQTLDYLRDAVGLLTFYLDNGACAIYDPQMF